MFRCTRGHPGTDMSLITIPENEEKIVAGEVWERGKKEKEKVSGKNEEEIREDEKEKERE